MDLFKIKQLPHQTLKEFLSTVRIHGMKVLQCYDGKNKEKMLITCFISGLANKRYSQILQELKPKTLNEAFELIKYEKDDNQPCEIYAINQTKDCFNLSCQNLIERL